MHILIFEGLVCLLLPTFIRLVGFALLAVFWLILWIVLAMLVQFPADCRPRDEMRRINTSHI
jgi:hypothetical protein